MQNVGSGCNSWNDVAAAELNKIGSEADRKRIEALTAEFEKAQADFNSAYEGYQRIQREIYEQHVE